MPEVVITRCGWRCWKGMKGNEPKSTAKDSSLRDQKDTGTPGPVGWAAEMEAGKVAATIICRHNLLCTNLRSENSDSLKQTGRRSLLHKRTLHKSNHRGAPWKEWLSTMATCQYYLRNVERGVIYHQHICWLADGDGDDNTTYITELLRRLNEFHAEKVQDSARQVVSTISIV